MIRFILVTFIFLAWAFWEMSGGSGFAPESSLQAGQTTTPAPAATPATPAAQQVPQAIPAALSQPSPDPVPETPVANSENNPLFDALEEATAFTVSPEQQQSAAQPAALATQEPEVITVPDLRLVDATRVNMRSGPSTDYRVLDTLSRGTVVELLESGPDGWAKLLVLDTGLEGWMSTKFLSDL